MTEIWKDVIGYEGLYQISNLGNIKSLDRVLKNRWGNYIRKGAVMALNMCNRYAAINLFVNWKFKHCKIHRLVAIAFIPNHENKPEVNHINGNRYDNRAENLEWVTTSENELHAYRTGLKKSMYGDKNPAARLSYKKVDEIKKKYSSEKISMSKLAEQYGVSKSTIFNALSNNFWNKQKAA